jgi:multidrug resistance efflux pump
MQAAIDKDKADLDRAKADFDRSQSLFNEHLISKQDFELKKFSYDAQFGHHSPV